MQAEEAKGKRGMTLGIYGGLGHHRYPLVVSSQKNERLSGLSGLSKTIYDFMMNNDDLLLRNGDLSGLW